MERGANWVPEKKKPDVYIQNPRSSFVQGNMSRQGHEKDGGWEGGFICSVGITDVLT